MSDEPRFIAVKNPHRDEEAYFVCLNKDRPSSMSSSEFIAKRSLTPHNVSYARAQGIIAKLEAVLVDVDPQVACPTCGSVEVTKIYRPEVYEFPYICRKCDQGFTA